MTIGRNKRFNLELNIHYMSLDQKKNKLFIYKIREYLEKPIVVLGSKIRFKRDLIIHSASKLCVDIIKEKIVQFLIDAGPKKKESECIKNFINS
jgi:hypothetical protein